MAIKDDLISYWELNEASGDRSDSHSDNTLTDNNTVGSAAGKMGNAASFINANSEYLSRASEAELQTGDIDFTFALWALLDNKSSTQFLIGKDDFNTSGRREYGISYNSANDRFRFEVFKATDTAQLVEADILGSPSTATWYFIVCWHDATANSMSIQVNNGTADTLGSLTGLQAAGGALFCLGARFAASLNLPLDGDLDEVGFWKRVLAADERTFLYNGGSGRSYAGLTAAATRNPFFFSTAGWWDRLNGILRPANLGVAAI